jgi:hypothetical protein
MRTYSKKQLEATRPNSTERECVEYCLTNLYASDTLGVDDQITPGFTYEELIGALLLARDAIDERDALLKQLEERE